MVTLGQTFRFQVEGAHLWTVITTPDGHEGTFVMVNVTTFAAHKDTSCVLHAGDHPDIQHDSVIYYADARAWWNVGPNGHDYWTGQGQIEQRDPLNNAILRRIQDGALASPFFKRKFIPLVQTCLV